VAANPANGEMEVYEQTPQIPGQQSMSGDVQDEPKILKFEKRA